MIEVVKIIRIKMKNRIEKLKPLIDFNKDEFIVVRILQRKKDNPNLEILNFKSNIFVNINLL